MLLRRHVPNRRRLAEHPVQHSNLHHELVRRRRERSPSTVRVGGAIRHNTAKRFGGLGLPQVQRKEMLVGREVPHERDAREVPHLFVKGYGRSVGLADMAVALRTGRPHRADGQQAFAVLASVVSGDANGDVDVQLTRQRK